MRIGLTQKEIIAKFKESRQYIISFDASGKRVMTLGSADIFRSMDEIMRQQSRGNISLVLTSDEYDKVPFLSSNIKDYQQIILSRKQ